MSDETFLKQFEQRHNLVAHEACRMLGLPYSTYMRARKIDVITPHVRLHIEALDLLSAEAFRELRVTRTGNA